MTEDYDYDRYCIQCERPIEAGSNYCKPCDEHFKAMAKNEESQRLWEAANPKETFDTFNDDPFYIEEIVEPEDLNLEPVEVDIDWEK